MNIGKCASTLKFFLRVMADVWTEFVDIGGEVAQPSSRAGESIYLVRKRCRSTVTAQAASPCKIFGV